MNSPVMMRAFFDELQKIAAQEAMHWEARRYFEKVAKKDEGVGESIDAGVGAGVGAAVAGGAGILSHRKRAYRKMHRLYDRHMINARTAAKVEHISNAAKRMTDRYTKKSNRALNLLLPTAAAVGVGAGLLDRRSKLKARKQKKSSMTKRGEASPAGAIGPNLFSTMQSPFRAAAPPKPSTGAGMAGLKMKGPTIGKGPGLGKIGSAPAKDDGWQREGDTLWDRHKRKIISGLAMATAVGVGAKLMHSRWTKARVPKMEQPVDVPPSVHPRSKAKVRRAEDQARPMNTKFDRAEAEARMDPRKQRGRRRREQREQHAGSGG